MSPFRSLALAGSVLAVILPLMAQKTPAPSSHHMRAASAQPAHKEAPPKGQLIFQQNCSRCHDAPQSFPPQISGTILRHMRVRASLNANDEKELLQFMNP
jgi:cytochrome c5